MRRPLRSRVLVAITSCAALALIALARPATAAPPSPDAATDAKAAAGWLASQVTSEGFIPQASDPTAPNLSSTAQALLALAAAGVGRAQVDAMVTYLGAHVDEFAVRDGADDAGVLSLLVLDAQAAGQDPAAFGAAQVDLVARLLATQQADGLFGSHDPTFDGAFRQGLALLALGSVGETNSDGVDWLVDQQCDDGLWTAFRADTTTACPAVDPTTFSGPDTNSTAMAVLGLQAQGNSTDVSEGIDALNGVRNADEAWGFLAATDQATDANSTGVVVSAIRTVTGSLDPSGIAALLALQVGCDGDPADVGGVAFMASTDGLVPDVLATAQAVPALADVALPLVAPQITDGAPPVCTPVTTAPPTTATTGVGGDGATASTASTVPAARALARSGSPAVGETGVALVLIGGGAALVCWAGDRRRRTA